MTALPDGLPDGLLVAWYGDDFTGSAAVMEVLTFAGLPSVLFLDLPTPEQLARFGADAQRICAYFPWYEASDDLIAEFTAELKAASA